MWFVYILETKDGRFYTGITNDIDRRMKMHEKGRGARFTKNFGFNKLLYKEVQSSHSDALKREREIKSWSRAKKAVLIKKSTTKY